MRSLMLIILIYFSGYNLMAQNLDSLWNIWYDETLPDTTRLRAIQKFAWDGYLYSQPDSAFHYAQLQYDFAKNKGLKKHMANALNVQGVSHAIRGDFSQALHFYNESLQLFQVLGDKVGIASQLNNIGTTYYQQGNYPLTLEYLQNSLAIEAELGHKKGMASTLNNIGIIYDELKNFHLALEYYKKSLAIEKELDNLEGIAASLNNIGTCYQSLGEDTQALEYFQRSLSISKEMKLKQKMANSLGNIGVVTENLGNDIEALQYYQEGLRIFEEIDDKYGQALLMNSIGMSYIDQGNYAKALEYCVQGLVLSESLGILLQQKRACECLYNAYYKMSNPAKALEYYKQAVQYKDSLFNEENTKKVTQLEMQYEFDKKEAITRAEQEKKDAIVAKELEREKLVRNGFVGGFAVILLFASVFFVQRNRIGKEKERSEELLLNILPEETARELKEKGESDAHLIDQVTVLFTDFKGFTALSEKVTPKELVADLHKCFSAFDHICDKYGIEKIKTIGDAYMAAGGLPSSNRTHAQDVVNAALEMAEVVEKGKLKKTTNGLPFFEIRIGAHTGPVVAGIVGVKKFQYDIWGDTVNTASRMESSGEVGKVNISEATYELLKDNAHFSFESRGKILAKGKGEIEMYFASKT